jgi:hypothetical protein
MQFFLFMFCFFRYKAENYEDEIIDLNCLHYYSIKEIVMSDHKPVKAIFEVNFKFNISN